MTIIDFFLQLNPLLSSLIVMSITAIIMFLGNKGFEISSKGKTLKIFSKKKDAALQNALIIEKIIEIAYEISYRKKDKKIKNQMNFTEQTFDEMITLYEKIFRSDLEDLLKKRNLSATSLEKHPDLEMFKVCLKILKTNWKNLARTYFSDLFEVIDNMSATDFEIEKGKFIFCMKKEREDLLNELYKDQVRNYSRDVSRSKIYYSLKKDELQFNHLLKEIVNSAKTVNDRVKLEEFEKRQELQEFIKENLI